MAMTTEERRTVRAQVRYARVSPYKIREVLQLIRGRAAGEAAEALALSERDPATVVAKCLASAVANAEHNDQIDESELFVAEWDVRGRSAGLERNRAMADAGDQLLAVWDGYSRGTRHMIDEMLRRR